MPRYNNIKDAKNGLEKELAEIFRAGALTTFGNVIQGSPVGNRELWQVNKNRGQRKLQPKGYVGGNFRGNWQASVRNPITSIVPDARNRRERLDIAISPNIKLSDVLYLTNNLPYAQRLEEGWSTQRPSGWVRATVVAGEADMRRAASMFKGL